MARPVKELKPGKEQKKKDQPVVLTVLDAARRYGVNPATIHRGIAAGRIKTVQLNRRHMVLVSSIEGTTA
jgi:PII-like signaling protein